MAVMLDALSWILLMGGSLLLIIGGVGLLRFPDFYSRMQAAGVTDTLCSALVMIGLMLQAETVPMAAKLMFTLLFLLLTAPTATHAVAKAAHHGNLEIWTPPQRRTATRKEEGSSTS